MTHKISLSSLLDLGLVLFFMTLAGYLRITGLENANFNFDESYALELAADILNIDPFTARGLPPQLAFLTRLHFPIC